jgi:hypothetical protein
MPPAIAAPPATAVPRHNHLDTVAAADSARRGDPVESLPGCAVFPSVGFAFVEASAAGFPAATHSTLLFAELEGGAPGSWPPAKLEERAAPAEGAGCLLEDALGAAHKVRIAARPGLKLCDVTAGTRSRTRPPDILAMERGTIQDDLIVDPLSAPLASNTTAFRLDVRSVCTAVFFRPFGCIEDR